MAERLDLTTPVTTPTLNNWRVLRLNLYKGLVVAEANVDIHLIGDNNARFNYVYSGQTAYDMILFLNKANLSVQSLERRVLSRLIADGIISGTVSGTPE